MNHVSVAKVQTLSLIHIYVTIVKTKEWEIYIVVNKGFELFFGTVGEEDVG